MLANLRHDNVSIENSSTENSEIFTKNSLSHAVKKPIFSCSDNFRNESNQLNLNAQMFTSEATFSNLQPSNIVNTLSMETVPSSQSILMSRLSKIRNDTNSTVTPVPNTNKLNEMNKTLSSRKITNNDVTFSSISPNISCPIVILPNSRQDSSVQHQNLVSPHIFSRLHVKKEDANINDMPVVKIEENTPSTPLNPFSNLLSRNFKDQKSVDCNSKLRLLPNSTLTSSVNSIQIPDNSQQHTAVANILANLVNGNKGLYNNKNNAEIINTVSKSDSYFNKTGDSRTGDNGLLHPKVSDSVDYDKNVQSSSYNGLPFEIKNDSGIVSDNIHLKSEKNVVGDDIYKMYKCKFCDKKFDRAFSCNRHERVHTGYKPCHCKYCGKGFSEPRNLRHHIIRFHSDGKLKHLIRRDRRRKGETSPRSNNQIGKDEMVYNNDMTLNRVSPNPILDIFTQGSNSNQASVLFNNSSIINNNGIIVRDLITDAANSISIASSGSRIYTNPAPFSMVASNSDKLKMVASSSRLMSSGELPEQREFSVQPSRNNSNSSEYLVVQSKNAESLVPLALTAGILKIGNKSPIFYQSNVLLTKPEDALSETSETSSVEPLTIVETEGSFNLIMAATYGNSFLEYELKC